MTAGNSSEYMDHMSHSRRILGIHIKKETHSVSPPLACSSSLEEAQVDGLDVSALTSAQSQIFEY